MDSLARKSISRRSLPLQNNDDHKRDRLYVYGRLSSLCRLRRVCAIGNGYIGPIPFPIILLLILVALGQFILVKTKFGRYSCAIGGNKEAARLSESKSTST